MKARLFFAVSNARLIPFVGAIAFLGLAASVGRAQNVTISPGGSGVIGTTDVTGAGYTSGTLTWDMDVDAGSANCDTITGPGMAILGGVNWVVNINVIGTQPSTATSTTYTLFAADSSVAWFVQPTVSLVGGRGSTGASLTSFSIAPPPGPGAPNQPPFTVTLSYPGSGGTCSQTNSIVGLANNHNGTFTLTAAGTPQATYYVVTTTNVALPISQWQVLTDSTNTVVNGNGTWTYTTSGSPQQQQFYATVALNACPP